MSQKVIVIDFSDELVAAMDKKIIAARVDRPEMITMAANRVNDRNTLYCLLFDYRGKLADMPLSEEWLEIPMAVYLDGMGDFPRLVPRLSLLRKMNLKVYLPSSREESYREIKILASLGVHGCLVLEPGAVDWELVSDLMHYAIYTKTKHASIDPFSYIVKKHHKDARTNYDYVYFNDPESFIHVGENQEIALRQELLREEKFIGKGLELIDTIDEMEEYKAFVNSWQEDFIRTTPCSFCAAWRICLSKFAGTGNLDDCSAFFQEMLDAVDYVKKRDKIQEPVT